MSTPQNPLFETALSLPQSERADLAFQLLQTLTPPGEEVSTSEFSAELQGRVDAYRRGELSSYDVDEARAVVAQRLAEDRSK